jgi:hypothetical protein
VNARAFGVVAHAIEQHGLADAAQADHQHALGRQAATHTLDGHAHRFSQLVATRQFGRRRSSARGERVANGVHAR